MTDLPAHRVVDGHTFDVPETDDEAAWLYDVARRSESPMFLAWVEGFLEGRRVLRSES